MSEDDFRESALRLASVLGWPVFPLAPQSKVPVIAKEDGGHGYLDATTDPEQINAWWVARPEANIGVDCGRSRTLLSAAQTAAKLMEVGELEDPALARSNTRWGRASKPWGDIDDRDRPPHR